MVEKSINTGITESIQKYIKKISEHYKIEAIILFGSYAKNVATKSSDLDLVIDSKEQLMGFKLYSLITKIEKAFSR